MKNYSRADGLPSNYINCIYQDSSGYIWFGTDKGLCRFDGKNYLTYTEKDGLGSNFIYTIFQDNNNNIWAGTFGGNVSELKGNKFLNYDVPDDSSKDILAINEDKFGRIYLVNYGVLNVFVKNKFLTRYLSYSAPLLLKLNDGTLLISDSLSIFRITPTNDDNIKMTRIIFPESTRKLLREELPIRALQRKNGNIGLLTEHSFIEFSLLPGNRAKIISEFHGKDFSSLAEDIFGNIWLNDNYKKVYELTGKKVIEYSSKDGFTNHEISYVYTDYEGNLWFGTMGGGVLELEVSHQNGIKLINKSSGLYSNEITTIFEDSKNNLWFGTPSGIDIYTGNKFYHITSSDQSYKDIRAFAEDSSHNIYFGTFHRLYGPANISKLVHKNKIPWIHIGAGVSAIYYEQNKNNPEEGPVLWVTTYGYGNYKISKGQVFQFNLLPDSGSNMYEDIITGKNGLWFLSRNNGASFYKNGKFIGYNVNNGFPSNVIYTLYQDNKNRVYFGTDDGLIEMEGKKIKKIGSNQGVKDNYILGIAPDKSEDGENSFWIVTDKHLFKFKNDRVMSSESINLLPDNRTSITRTFYDKKNNMFFAATSEGAVEINLSAVKNKVVAPKVVINLFQVNDKPAGVTKNHPLKLNYTEDNISLGFQALNFNDNSETKYEYKLDKDGEEKWSQPITENTIHYKNLSSGHYKFYVRAVNAAGILSSKPAEVSFTITPPFWDTTWFIIITGILLTGFVGGTSRYVGTVKMKKKLKDLERENAIEKERARISQDLHDHIGSSLTRINLLSELARSGGENEILDKISRTTIDIIQTMDEIVWVISPQNDMLNNLVDYVIQYANEFFEGSRINCRFNLPALFPEKRVRHELRHNIFLTIKEALNNILKHSGADEVNLKINYIHGMLMVEISDNGTGFNMSESAGNGNGLNNMGKRIRDLGGKYEISSTENVGTIIKFAVSIND